MKKPRNRKGAGVDALHLFSGLFNVARNPVTKRHARSLRLRLELVNPDRRPSRAAPEPGRQAKGSRPCPTDPQTAMGRCRFVLATRIRALART